MKLYLWRVILSDYTDGCAFAIAETLADAKAQLLVTRDPPDGSDLWLPFAEPDFFWPEPEVHELTAPLAFWRYGGG